MILQKLSEARAFIKGMDLKKAGWNDHSKYHYFTPEQINRMVFEAETKTGLIHLFNLEKKDGDTYGYLRIIELETGESETFTQLTGIPVITATNVSQQIGGAVTYTNRYMLMTAFDISDNVLDFDDKDNREQPEKKPEVKKQAEKKSMPDGQFDKMMKLIKASKGDEYKKHIEKGQAYFAFTEKQDSTLRDYIDNKDL